MSLRPQDRSGSTVVVGVLVIPVIIVAALAMIGRAFGPIGGGAPLLIAVTGLGLMIGAVVDLVQLINRRNGPWTTTDILWLIAIVLLGFVGPIVWLVSGRTFLVNDTEPENQGL